MSEWVGGWVGVCVSALVGESDSLSQSASIQL